MHDQRAPTPRDVRAIAPPIVKGDGYGNGADNPQAGGDGSTLRDMINYGDGSGVGLGIRDAHHGNGRS